MDTFNYLSVLISIILGLAITQVLTGLGRLINARARVKFYAPAVAWAVLLLVIDVQTWWSMFGMRAMRAWTFVDFLVVLLQPIVLYLLAALVLPEFSGDAPVDLRASYFAHSRWFFGLSVVLLIVSVSKDLTLAGVLPGRVNLAMHGVAFVMWGTGALTRRPWYHAILWPLAILFMIVYIALLFARLH